MAKKADGEGLYVVFARLFIDSVFGVHPIFAIFTQLADRAVVGCQRGFSDGYSGAFPLQLAAGKG